MRQKRHADPVQGGSMHRLGVIGSKALALRFILSQERGSSVAPALSRPSLKEATP
jgi:hypothetical protein